MKLNKKVLTGALALAMGLGVAAPAVNSFAAPADSTMEIVEKEYRAAGEAWLKAYNELEDAIAMRDDFDAKIKSAEATVQEAVDKQIQAERLDTAEEKEALTKATEAKTAAENALEEEKNGSNNKFRLVTLQKELDAAIEAEAKAQEAVDAKDKENKEALKKANQDVKDAKAALKDLKTAKKEATIMVGEEPKSIKDAIKELTQLEKDAKREFKKQGANDKIIEVMEKLGDVVLPDDEAVEEEEEKEDLTEKIEAQLAVNKKKLSALEALKEYIPETYKLYKDRIDTAIANAEKAIKTAEDFLAPNKKVSSLFTVAYAAEEEEKTAEEVLKDLQDSEKEMDDVMNDIEKDSKEENDKNEANTDDDADADDDANTDDDADADDDKAVVVEKKEDVKASTNVKTGVAGVAGVGAVLAAASAAYVSSKRK